MANSNSVWTDYRLPPPDHIQINGEPEQANLLTRVTNGHIVITYSLVQAINIAEKISNGKVRLVLRWSADDFKTSAGPAYSEWYSRPRVQGPTFVPDFSGLTFEINGLKQNTHYKFRAWAETADLRSETYNAFDFWTNRAPTLPEIIEPRDNQSFILNENIKFDWHYHDPDGDPQSQAAYQLRWRSVVDNQRSSPWVVTNGTGNKTERLVSSNVFRSNRYYEWQLRYRDNGNLWSEWSVTRSFYIKGAHSPPRAIEPTNDTALSVTDPIVFRWQFRDPESGDRQVKSDLRYRRVGASDSEWTLIPGATTTATSYQMPPNILLANVHYEWQVQTYDFGSGGTEPSGWSNIHTFYAIRPPGELATQPVIPGVIVKGPLGCGHNRVFVYQQGGQVKVGEITPIEQVVWRRQRDDISNCIVDTSGFGPDCGDLLARLRSWQHELVVFRDGVRVWEGPITRITYTVDNVEVEAKDVIGYVYRRIMRQGYNDQYNCSNDNPKCKGGIQTGQNTVIYRASRIITDALGRGDPNVLPYLTPINNPDSDARQSRDIPDYSKTAWEEIDDLAATAGLDYVAVGRRIVLWDTHFPIGKLPEMRDEDFTDPVIVTEYGMNLCNYFGVTNGTGVWGAAWPHDTTPPPGKPTVARPSSLAYYGPVEMLASSYGDSEKDDSTSADTPASIANLQNKYATQAEKSIAHRWPTPVVVRVPDNTSLNPDVNLDINQLVPGVWIPLRSTATLREVAQWQKLDSVTVTETAANETIQVVMSPAPNGGNDDPDAGDESGDEESAASRSAVGGTVEAMNEEPELVLVDD